MDVNVNRETLTRLKFISKIEIDDKINIKTMTISSNGLLTQVTRTILQENRAKTLTFITDTINKTFEILNCYGRSTKLSDKIMCTNLIHDLKLSIKGLENLKQTYILDIKFCCDIDYMIQVINAKLSEIDETYSPLTSPSLLYQTELLPPPPPQD